MSRLTAPEPLGAAHDLSRFDCGQESLNNWLKELARVSEGRTARTYVASDDFVVVGYYCISAGSVERQAMPSTLRRSQGLPRYIPLTIIGRLARDTRYRGTRLGADLLRDALLRILAASKIVGSQAVLVHAIDDAAKRFWIDNGFVESPIGSGTLFLPIETIADAL